MLVISRRHACCNRLCFWRCCIIWGANWSVLCGVGNCAHWWCWHLLFSVTRVLFWFKKISPPFLKQKLYHIHLRWCQKPHLHVYRNLMFIFSLIIIIHLPVFYIQHQCDILNWFHIRSHTVLYAESTRISCSSHGVDMISCKLELYNMFLWTVVSTFPLW